MTAFSYQLYSSRNFPPLADTLTMLADLGYAEVEGYGALYADPALVSELKTHLGASGLTTGILIEQIGWGDINVSYVPLMASLTGKVIATLLRGTPTALEGAHA